MRTVHYAFLVKSTYFDPASYAVSYIADASFAAHFVATSELGYVHAQRDAERLMVDIPKSFAHPLWSDTDLKKNPKLQTAYDNLLAYFDSDPKTWYFWRR